MYHFVDLVILILKIYKWFKMDYVVKEINGLEVVKKSKKEWFIWNKSVFLQPFMIIMECNIFSIKMNNTMFSKFFYFFLW